jgi:HK97 family phage portal protein
MNIWQSFKSLFIPARVADGSMTYMPSGTVLRYPDFDLREGVRRFTGWIYAATMLNANACASVPLKLYLRNGSAQAKVYRHRSPSRGRKAFLRGDTEHMPSRYVTKAANEFSDDFEEATEDHPILKLLDSVSPILNGYTFNLMRHVYLQLTGNAYIYWVPDARTGQPVELYLLPAQWMYVVPGARGSGEFIREYQFGANWLNRVSFDPDEICHIRYPNPRNQYYGLGKIEAGWACVEANRSVHEMDAALYLNHARPDYTMFVEGLGSEAIKRLENDINMRLRGTHQSGKLLIVGGKGDIKPTAWPPKDLADRDNIVEEIAAVFGVPVTKLKANDPNKANAKQGDAGWMADTILPMLRQDEQALNEWILPLFDMQGQAFLAYENPVPADQVLERDTHKAYVQMGVMTINETREEIGMEPQEGGDTLLVPNNVVPLEQALKPPAPPPQFPPPGFGKSPQLPDAKPADNSELPELPEPPAKHVNGNGHQPQLRLREWYDSANSIQTENASRRALDPTTPPEPSNQAVVTVPAPAAIMSQRSLWLAHRHGEHTIFHEQPDGECKALGLDPGLERLCERLQAVFDAVLGDQEKDCRKWLDEHVQKSQADDIEALRAKLAAYDEQLADLARQPIQDIYEWGGEKGLRAIDQSGGFDVSNPKVQEFLDSYTIRLAGQVNATTIDEITTVIGRGMDEGKGNLEIGTDVANAGTFDGHRGMMIARTEGTRASEQGSIAAWKESGVVEGKRWLLAPDCCDFCAELADQFAEEEVGLEEDFFSKGDTIEAGGQTMVLDYSAIDAPPLHPHCMCTLIPVLKAAPVEVE